MKTTGKRNGAIPVNLKFKESIGDKYGYSDKD
jgi:hypothetical protein